MGRAIDLTPAFIVDPDVLIDVHRATPQGLVGAALARTYLKIAEGCRSAISVE
jgi:hypothetical protein